MKKQYVIGTITLAVAMAGMTMTAYADGWKQNEHGWWYEKADTANGWYADGWHWIDGNQDGIAECYYFGAGGYLKTDGVTPDGYTVNVDGAWTVNGEIQKQQNTQETKSSVDWNSVDFSGVYYMYPEYAEGLDHDTTLTITKNTDGTYHFIGKNVSADFTFFDHNCQVGPYNEIELSSGDGRKEIMKMLSFNDANGEEIATYNPDNEDFCIWPGFEITYFGKDE